MKKGYLFILLAGAVLYTSAKAETTQATVYRLTPEGTGAVVGTITFTDTAQGLRVDEKFKGLEPGEHGIHIHENGNCGSTVVDGKTVLGGAAGGHYDPHQTGRHAGPGADGHQGDLPALFAASDGTVQATHQLTGVQASDFKGRAVIIHAGGDNYQDTPEPLGGGGGRIACGVIE